MSRVPPEPPTWEQEPDELLAELRRQLERVKAKMAEHRDQMRAAGLTLDHDRDAPGP